MHNVNTWLMILLEKCIINEERMIVSGEELRKAWLTVLLDVEWKIKSGSNEILWRKEERKEETYIEYRKRKKSLSKKEKTKIT